MKIKLLSIALVMVLAVGLTGCIGGSDEVNDTEREAVTTQQQQQQTGGHATNNQFQDLEIVEFGYYIIQSSLGNMFLRYSIFLRNPNDDAMVIFSRYRIVARSEDGRVLGTREFTQGHVMPNEIRVEAGQAFQIDERPATVEVEIISLMPHQWSHNFPNIIPLTVV